MRLTKFIDEKTLINEGRHEEIQFDADNEDELVYLMSQRLFKDCGPYLKDLAKSGKVLYRGAYGGDMTKIVPRKNRRPSDMDPDLQEELDDAFYSHVGWRPRSEGVFCSGNRSQAQFYGTGVYTVWPIGKYKIVWCPHIEDLYTYLDGQYGNNPYDIDTSYFEDDYYNLYGEGLEGTWWYDGDDTNESDKADARDVVADWLRDDYDEDDEDYDPYEDMDEYNFEWMPDVDLETYLEEEIANEIERRRENRYEVVFEYKDDDIKKAIDSHNEIMIGCKAYYLIDDAWTDGLNEILAKGRVKPAHKQLKFKFMKGKRKSHRR